MSYASSSTPGAKAIGQFLNLREEELHERIQRVTLQAAKGWPWYGVAPSASSLPLLPPDE